MELPDELAIKTDNYEFIIKIIKSTYDFFHSFTFRVGEKSKPCLELYVQLPVKTDEIEEHYTIALLNNIDALIDCSTTDINENYLRKHSFGLELLLTIDDLLKRHFPHIRSVKLYDASYMPCNRAYGDTLDLLSYSIALYGKTWYEIKRNAYIVNPSKRNIYNRKIAQYTSKEFKASISAETFLNSNIFRSIHVSNHGTYEFFKTNYDQIINLYKNAQTFPDFFKALRDIIPETQRCQIFKTWLQSFIETHVYVDRNWQYDLYPKKTTDGRRRQTRRRKEYKKRTFV